MDEIAEQALSNMTAVLQSFLPAADPSVDQSLILIPKKINPTGLSGYVGTHADPDASLSGRHIQAISEVTLVSDNGVSDLQQAVSGVTQSLLSQDKATLRNNGIFKLQFDQVSDIARQGTGNNVTDTRLVRFMVDFEYIPVPVEEEGTIDFFIHNFDLALSQGKARFYQYIFSTLHNSGEDPLSYFDLEDDPDVAGSSPSGSWSYDVAEGYIEQTSDVRGGPATSGGKKAGAHALVRVADAPYEAKNFIARTTVNSADTDGIGLVFRKLDHNNFYYLLLSARHEYTLLGKKVAGSYGLLQEGGLNDGAGHNEASDMEIKLIVDGNRFQVYLDNQFVTAGEDSDITEGGRLGFFTHRNSAAHFFDLTLVEFGG
ncbi:MAG: hypothetical protein R3208_08265 [Ketobacteraceae bacterium]|nr:hypothetical protein [Ketobacteraceae bacterium]